MYGWFFRVFEKSLDGMTVHQQQQQRERRHKKNLMKWNGTQWEQKPMMKKNIHHSIRETIWIPWIWWPDPIEISRTFTSISIWNVESCNNRFSSFACVFRSHFHCLYFYRGICTYISGTITMWKVRAIHSQMEVHCPHTHSHIHGQVAHITAIHQ